MESLSTAAIRMRKFRAENPEAVKQIRRRHRAKRSSDPIRHAQFLLKERDRQRQKYNTPEGKDRQWKNNIKYRYGITLEEYNQKFDAQGGVCWICKQPELSAYTNRLHVDHCHITGKIRGLLCHHCNTGIGHLRHDPNLLSAAITYLTITTPS